MAILNKAWNNFKARPDAWFFYGFLLSFPLSVRKVLFFYPIRDNFNEYTGIYLYLSDVLLILTILAWLLVILQNKKINLSSCIQFFSRQEVFVLPLVLAIWAFISVSWAGNTNLAFFRSLKIAEFSLLFLYLAYNVPRPPRVDERFPRVEAGGTFMRNIVRLVIALGFIQAIISISQAVLQHSVGLFWLKESLISVNMDGVAKVVLFGHKFIRVYGLFPHPNILGGFLLLTIVLTFVYGRTVPRLPRETKMFPVEHFNVSCGGTIKYIFLFIQVVALLLTFSKSAILGLFIVICYLGYKMFHFGRNVPSQKECSTGNILRDKYGTSYWASARLAPTSGFRESRRVEHFYRYLITTVIIWALFITILSFNTNSLLFKSLNERLLYLNVSYGTIINNPIVGIGMGQFVAEMQKYSSVFLANWQYQPVHNVFLLIWSELGIIGLVLFILFLWKVFRANTIVSCETIAGADGTIVFKAIFLGFTIIMLFDHYFWDIQQGQIMLWIVLGLVAGIKNSRKQG